MTILLLNSAAFRTLSRVMIDPNPPSFYFARRSEDLTRLLRMRATEPSGYSTIGFYRRSTKDVSEMDQSAFILRAGALSLQMEKAGVKSGDNTLIVCTSPEAALTAFVASVLIGAIPAIVAVRAAFDDRVAVMSRIRASAALVPGEPVVLAEGSGVEPSVATLPELNTIVVDVVQLAPLATIDTLQEPLVPSVCHVQLTSGSTGAGKGVLVSHANLLANVRAMQERAEINEYSVFVTWLPLYHDMGLVGQALFALITGADIHFLSPFDFLADPAAWVETISEKHGTMSASPTFGYELVTAKTSDKRAAALDLSSWKSAYCGAEPIVAAVPQKFLERFGSSGLRAEAFTPCYGLAEATVAVSGIGTGERWRTLVVSRGSLAELNVIKLAKPGDVDAIEVVALGTPVKGLTVELYDSNHQPVTDELVCGEIVVNGTSVTDGWLQSGGLAQPFAEEGLRTGDIGFFESGELFVVERIKNIITRKGHNYSAQVLEQTLADALSLSTDQVVILDRDILSGAELTAVIELDKGTDQAELRQKLEDNIDRFEPPLDLLILAKKASIPRTTSGKKRHAELRQLLVTGQFNSLAEHTLTSTASAPLRLDLSGEVVATAEQVVRNSSHESRVLALVSRHVRERELSVPVVLQSRLQYDLDFDSLAVLELAMATEEEFAIDLDRQTVAGLKTVNDLLRAVQSASPRNDDIGSNLIASMDQLRAQIPQAFTEVEAVRPHGEAYIQGRWLTDFASCNYLGLDHRQEMFDAVNQLHAEWGLQRFPTRAVATARPAIELERRLADLIGVPDAMIFPTISLVHMGVLPLLAGAHGAIIIDSAAHRSMQDAALLAKAKGADLSTFKHGHLEELERKLQRFAEASTRVIVLDGVYSMSGSTVDLAAHQALAEKYDAVVYLDDAHGFGVYGENPSAEVPYGYRGNGTVKHLGCSYDRIIYVAGMAKAYSSPCAFISCPTPEYRKLFSAASTMVFAQTASMAGLAQTNAGLNISEVEGTEIRARLFRQATRLIAGAKAMGFTVGSDAIPIVNVIIGNIEDVIVATNILWEDGILLTPAVFPAAPLNRGGLRFTVTANNTEAQIDQALASLKRIKAALEARSDSVINLSESVAATKKAR